MKKILLWGWGRMGQNVIWQNESYLTVVFFSFNLSLLIADKKISIVHNTENARRFTKPFHS